MENFDAPYLAASVADFWRRWHISLTSWFRDYLYIPLGGSREGKVRKYANKMLVFLLSGLWHGASVSFVIWGCLNGIYQVMGEVLQPARDRVVKIFQLNRQSIGHKLLQVVGTFALVDFSWIFFRAGSTRTAIDIIKNILSTRNPWILFDGSLYTCGLDSKEFGIMVVCILVLLAVDLCKYRHITVRDVIIKQDYWFRWFFIAFSIVFILVFGVWGTEYDASGFIYFQF